MIRVFTNGCFDIIHPGHIQLLRAARNLGDFLIVGLNSDESVKFIKGKDRPINNQYDRISVLHAIHYVDAVYLFDELTPLNLIRELKPDILVKGSDYKSMEVVGKKFVESYGGRVEFVPLLEGYSTTTIINRILLLKGAQQ